MNLNESLFVKSTTIEQNHSENPEIAESYLTATCHTNKLKILNFKSESEYQDLIIEQKNMLITELTDEIDLLRKHITLLGNFYNPAKNPRKNKTIIK